jgi:hypothetical protein
MPITTEIDGVQTTLEKLPDGSIRVSHESDSFNAMHGPATSGEVWYLVHPIQRHQYEYLNALLPPNERSTPKDAAEQRPWWSYVAVKKDQARASGGDEE